MSDVIQKIFESATRVVGGADDFNYETNRCTVELDDVEELDLWLEEYRKEINDASE